MIVVMGKYEQRGPGNSLFSSKWFVVAACGAIAMVLGAMSVGARSGPHRDPVAEYPTPIAANQTVFLTEDGGTTPTTLYTPEGTKQSYMDYRQSSPPPEGPSNKSNAMQIAPVEGLGISLSISPLSGSITVSPAQIITSPLETPEPTTETSSAADASTPPLQGTTTDDTSGQVDVPESSNAPEMAAE